MNYDFAHSSGLLTWECTFLCQGQDEKYGARIFACNRLADNFYFL